MSLLSRLPWNLLRSAFYALRRRLFTKERPERVHLETDADLETVRDELGTLFGFDEFAPMADAGFGFTNGWELSYNYHGEDLNMRLPVRVPDEYEWYQLHIRGFAGEGRKMRNWLDVHLELEPTEYPKGHLRGTNYEVRGARELFIEEIEPRCSFRTMEVEPA